MADDLADRLVGPAIVRLGPAPLALKARGPLEGENLEELVIAPLGEAELLCGAPGSEAGAAPLEEHGELPRDLVAGQDRDAARGSDEHGVGSDELEHDRSSCLRGQPGRVFRLPLEWSILGRGSKSQIKYGGMFARTDPI